MENTEYNVPEVEETDSQYSETGKYGDGVPTIDSSDIEEKVESDSGSWQDAIEEATEDRIQYDFSADDDTDDTTEENTVEEGDTVVEPSLEDVVKSRLEDTRADIVEDVDNIFANIVLKFEDAGGSFENETGDELVKNAEEEFGIDDADYSDTDSSFDKIVVLKEAVIAKRLREAEGQFTVEEALKKADKKDWDRALANYSDAQIESMFNKITDPRKKIGRAIAFWTAPFLLHGWSRGRYLKYIRDFIDQSALDNFFHDGDGYYSSCEQCIVDLWPKVKDIINASPEAVGKFEEAYNEALKTIDQKAAEKKAAEMKKAAEKAKKDKETEWLKKQYQAASGNAVFQVSSDWNSFGGYIGQYSKVAYTPSGRKMSEEEINRKIQKYDNENYYEPKYFAVAGYHGGYDRDFGVDYSGKEIYTLDIEKAYEDYINYSTDGYLSIYKISKRIKMEESLEAENNDSALTDYQKDVIKEMVKCDLECGHSENDYDELVGLFEEEEDFAGVEPAAADYYMELLDYGPAGFYEEFKDELDFDPDFIAEYGDEDDDENSDED